MINIQEGFPPDIRAPVHSLSRESFELRTHRLIDSSRLCISWLSRRYGLRQEIALQDEWAVNTGGVEELMRFISLLIGGMIKQLEDLNISTGDIQTTLHSLSPHFDRMIYNKMRELEYQARFTQRFNENHVHLHILSSHESSAARKKAKALLLRHLSPEQAEDLKKEGWFTVKAKDGKTYRITQARAFNVVGSDGTKYCGQLADAPIEDQMLAQKLLLEHDLDAFFKNANISRSGGRVSIEQTFGTAPPTPMQAVYTSTDFQIDESPPRERSK